MMYLPDLVLIGSILFTLFILYAGYKQDRDPDWAYGGVIVMIFVLTLLGGTFGWKTGYKIGQDITFLAHWHILEIFMVILFAIITFFISTIVLITGLAHRAYDKNWNELATKLTRMMSGRS